MAIWEIYKGPGRRTKPAPPTAVIGEYTAILQALSMGVPEEQLQSHPEDEELVRKALAERENAIIPMNVPGSARESIFS